MASSNSRKVVTGLVRFAYVNVQKPSQVYDDEKRYSVSVLIRKDDKETIESIISAVDAAMEKGKKKLEKARFEDIKMPIRDGDLEKSDNEAYKDCYFFNAYSKTKPRLVNSNLKEIEDESEFYNGCYGRASITFYAYKHEEPGAETTFGIACGLGNLQKLKEGQVIKVSTDPEVEFGDSTSDF